MLAVVARWRLHFRLCNPFVRRTLCLSHKIFYFFQKNIWKYNLFDYLCIEMVARASKSFGFMVPLGQTTCKDSDFSLICKRGTLFPTRLFGKSE